MSAAGLHHTQRHRRSVDHVSASALSTADTDTLTVMERRHTYQMVPLSEE